MLNSCGNAPASVVIAIPGTAVAEPSADCAVVEIGNTRVFLQCLAATVLCSLVWVVHWMHDIVGSLAAATYTVDRGVPEHQTAHNDGDG